MDKKELIVSLMKLDWAYSQKVDAIDEVWDCAFTEAKLFNEKDNNGKKIKDIYDIVFEYAGIPKDSDEYCRDFIDDIYFNVTAFSDSDDVNFELTAEILISVGENKGQVLPKYKKYFNEAYL